jgi:hypothetical protein
MNNRFGIIQGRLIKPPTNDLLQYFPPNWIDEINIAKIFKFGFIEFFKDRDFNQICPFYTKEGFKIVFDVLNLKDFKSYSFCDDFFIKKNILKYKFLKKYFKDMSLNLSIIKTKIYVLPLYEKSGLAITYGAVALGATSIERHITLDRSMYGSDQPASMTVAGFEEMVGGIRNLEKALNGEKNKKILDIEIPLIQKLRSHIKSKN